MPTLNWVFGNQLVVSGILTQLCSRKQLARRCKMSLKRGAGSYLYNIYIYTIDLSGKDGWGAFKTPSSTISENLRYINIQHTPKNKVTHD